MKKTSGRYKLVMIDLLTKKKITIACDTVTGAIEKPSSKMSSGLDLTVLDQFILRSFVSEQDLLQSLQLLGYIIPNNFVPRIAYQSQKKTRYLELVYQNRELYDFASLCKKYKKKYAIYAQQYHLSSRQLRKIISQEIAHEPIWIQFYQSLLKNIHSAPFYHYLLESHILKDRELNFIRDYLANEKGTTSWQQTEFESAKYYLVDTFTSYKPIRGMIVCLEQYRLLQKSDDLNYIEWYKQTKRLLTDFEINYLESHEIFEKLSNSEKVKFVNSLLESEKTYVKK